MRCRLRPTPFHYLLRFAFNPRNTLPAASPGTTLGAWLLTEMGMTDGLQQSFPFGQSRLLIPLTREGHTGARP